MDPVTLSLLLGGAQTGLGLIQRASAAKRRKEALANFKYEIPSAVKEQVGLARQRASRNKFPGEDIYRSRIESGLAQTAQKGESVSQAPSDVLGLYAKLYGQKTAAESDILQKEAAYKSQNEADLMNTLGLMANAQNQQFYYNKYLPFMQQMQMAGEQSAGGAANIAGGINTAYSGWMNNWMMDEYKKMYGLNNQQDNTGMINQLSENTVKSNEPYWIQNALPENNNLNVDYRTPLNAVNDLEKRIYSNPSRNQIYNYGG